VPGQLRSVCGYVNDHGEVVGTYRAPDGSGFDRFGFLLSKGEFTKIDDPNAQPFEGGTELNGINDPGDIVGFYFDDNHDTHGFVLSDGVYTALDVPGATLTIAQGISNPGEIVGQYNDAAGNGHGFVLNNGVYTTIDVPGADESQGGLRFFRSIRKAISWEHIMMLTAINTASSGRLPTEPSLPPRMSGRVPRKPESHWRLPVALAIVCSESEGVVLLTSCRGKN
jgi:hypothetical protein